MLEDRSQRIENLGSSPKEKLDARGELPIGAVKLGSTSRFFILVTNDMAELRSPGVGLLMTEGKTSLLPGRAFSLQTAYQQVDFNGLAFHPSADQPSTAVFPHATVVPKIVDPDLEMLQGVFRALQSLVGA